jgi:hypothetical protein
VCAAVCGCATQLITGPANFGKARAVVNRVRSEAERGREPMLVRPTRGDVERHRRELAEGGLVWACALNAFAVWSRRLPTARA